MLGYSVHPPFIGQVDGMSPARLVEPAPEARVAQVAFERGHTV